MASNSTECLKDPLKYFEDKNEGAECSCIKDGVIFPNRFKEGELVNREIPDVFRKWKLIGERIIDNYIHPDKVRWGLVKLDFIELKRR